MSTKQDWRELYEEKDACGYTVLDVAFWDNATPACYRYKSNTGNEGICTSVYDLIPRKPAPVTVAWEPDEVPVGAVVMMVKNPLFCGTIANRSGNMIGISGHRYVTCEELKDEFVLHQPGVATADCKPCGKVVQS